jgi:uncharacterized membrane protein YfcA
VELSPDIFALLVAVAAFAGFIDAIAGGGGLITVPALLAANVPPVQALATNKIQSTFGTATACFAFARGGHIDFRSMLLPVVGAFLGSAVGATVVQHVGSEALAAIVPLLLIAMALYFIFSPAMSDVDRHRRLEPPAYALAAAAVGFYDGFFGPGAGSVYQQSLVSLLGLGLVRATAHTKLLNVTSNIAAVTAMALGGQVLWVLGLAMAGAAMVGNHFGSKAAIRFGSRLIRPLLALMSVALTVKLLSDPENPVARMLWAG